MKLIIFPSLSQPNILCGLKEKKIPLKNISHVRLPYKKNPFHMSDYHTNWPGRRKEIRESLSWVLVDDFNSKKEMTYHEE